MKKSFLTAKKKAFTLIEVLICLTIIVIIALIAVGSFGGVQKQARLDFAADSFVSVIKEQFQLARSGRRYTENDMNALKCYIVKFQKEAIFTGLASYKSLDSAKPDDIEQKVDYCEETDDSNLKKADFLDQDLIVKKIQENDFLSSNNYQDLDTLSFYFKPPYAKIFMKDVATTLEKSLANSRFCFQIGFNQENGANDKTSNRWIYFNAQTGEVRKLGENELGVCGV